MPQDITQAAINTVPPEELERIFRVDQPYEDAGPPRNVQELLRLRLREEAAWRQQPTNYEDWLNQTTYSPEALRAVNMNQDPHVTAEERRQMMERYRQDMERGAWRFTTQGIYEEIQRVQTTPEEALTTEYRAHRDSIAKKKPDEPDPVDPKDWSPF